MFHNLFALNLGRDFVYGKSFLVCNMIVKWTYLDANRENYDFNSMEIWQSSKIRRRVILCKTYDAFIGVFWTQWNMYYNFWEND